MATTPLNVLLYYSPLLPALFTRLQMENIPLFGLLCCVLCCVCICQFCVCFFSFFVGSAQRASYLTLCSTTTGLDEFCCARSSGFQCITLETWAYSLCFAPGETRHFRHARLWRTCASCFASFFLVVNIVAIWISLNQFKIIFDDFWYKNRVLQCIFFFVQWVRFLVHYNQHFWTISSDNYLC